MMKATAQLTEECRQWRFTLRHLRDQFTNHTHKLEKKVLEKNRRLAMWEVEHLYNQFYIQLINIHDLKKVIKRHADNISKQSMRGILRDDTVALHCFLTNDVERLQHRLKSISDEFKMFLRNYPPAIYA